MRCLDLHTQQEPLFLKEDISHCHSHLMQFTGINIIIITTVVIHTSWSAKLTSHAKYYSACENSWIQSPVGFLFLFNLSLLKYVHLCISWKGGGRTIQIPWCFNFNFFSHESTNFMQLQWWITWVHLWGFHIPQSITIGLKYTQLSIIVCGIQKHLRTFVK